MGKVWWGRMLKLLGRLLTSPIPWLRVYFSRNFAKELAEATSRVLDGTPFVMATEALTGTPTTAHILGGCVIGKDPDRGVIDRDQKVFGYENLYVCDGSAISSNPGVNPALTISAMTERVMSKIPGKK